MRPRSSFEASARPRSRVTGRSWTGASSGPPRSPRSTSSSRRRRTKRASRRRPRSGRRRTRPGALPARIGQARLEEHDLLAVELGDGRARARRDRRSGARREPGCGSRGPVATSRRARSRRPRSGPPSSRLPSAADRPGSPAATRARDARGSSSSAAATELRPELGDVDVVVLDRHRRLREQVARVELGIHPVPRRAPLRVAVAQRPGERDRPAVARQQPRVLVDRAEAGHVERGLRDLPGEAPADRQVGLVRAQERLDRPLVAGEEKVEPRRRARGGEREERGCSLALAAPGASSATGSCPSSRSASDERLGDRPESCRSRRCARTRPCRRA